MMLQPIRTANPTLFQIAEDLNTRHDEQFIFIFLDRAKNEWVIELNEEMDGLQIAQILNVFQQKFLQTMIEQQQAMLAANKAAERRPQ